MFRLNCLLYFTVYLLRWINAVLGEGNNPFPTNSSLIPLVHFGDKNYYLGLHFKATYPEAMQFCQLINMRLISIVSEEQERPLFEYIRGATIKEHFWCSGTRAIDGKTWIWLTTGKKVIYTQWLANQPDGSNELCIELIPTGHNGLYWNDLGCDSRRNFICENLDGTTATAPSVQEQKSINPSAFSLSSSTCYAELTDPYPDNPFLPEIVLDGKLYRVSTVKVSAEKASQACKVYGMELFSITNAKKDEILTSLVQQSGNSGAHWTFGKRQPNGSWTWENLLPFTFTRWAPNEPSSTKNNELCLEIRSNGLWYDSMCDNELFFVCEDSTTGDSHHCKSHSINVYVSNNDI